MTANKVWDGAAWQTIGGGGGYSTAIPYETVTMITDPATGITVTADATPNTYGAWIELAASTSFDVGMLILQINTALSGSVIASVISIGIGAASSETEIFSFNCSSLAFPNSHHIPIFIPSGTRISARLMSNTASKTGVVHLGVAPTVTSLIPATTVDSLALDLAQARGIAVTSTSYVELVASTSRNYRAVILCFGISASVMSSGAQFDVFLAIGGLGVEVDLGFVNIVTNSNESVTAAGYTAHCIIVENIPAGSRLSGRLDASRSGATISLIGIPEI